ncbi:cyclophilin-like fold protein [Lysinibacillus sp. FSL H8-0500]|uniref:cyclophilin-like fold protein n=1 Tax=Lysinibacillus sp. FSL H8-0500 TaxID=2921393 RepID=UPI0031016A1A
MKNFTICLMILLLVVTACGSENKQQNQSKADETEKKSEEENTMRTTKVKLTFANEEVIVQMDNTPVVQDFLSLLPLTLPFEDYAGTERIGYLSKKLVTEGAPNGVEPKRGDLTYYAPWGNLALFYQDFRFSNGLIKLGTLEAGIEKLENLHGNFEITIEKID